MCPGDVISDTRSTFWSARLEKLDDNEIKREFERVKKHPEFDAYVAGVRCEIGETGEEKDAWKFGEEFFDLPLFYAWVEARDNMRKSL